MPPEVSAPLLSLIVPVYNTSAYLPRCLEACLSQSLQELEVLAVDDGSGDASPAILDAYAARDARLRVFHICHGGTSVARNHGLDQARGQYIWFIDSDDYPCPGAAAALYDAASRAACDICRGRPRIVQLDGREDHAAREFELALRHPSPLFFFSGFWTALFRRSFLESHNLRFAPGVDLGQDLLFLAAAVLACSSMSLLNREVYCYCQRPGSADAGCQVLDKDRLQRYLTTIRAVAELYYRAQCRADSAGLGYVWFHLAARLYQVAAGRAPGPAERQACYQAFRELAALCPQHARAAYAAYQDRHLQALWRQLQAGAAADPADAVQPSALHHA